MGEGNGTETGSNWACEPGLGRKGSAVPSREVAEWFAVKVSEPLQTETDTRDTRLAFE